MGPDLKQVKIKELGAQVATKCEGTGSPAFETAKNQGIVGSAAEARKYEGIYNSFL